MSLCVTSAEFHFSMQMILENIGFFSTYQSCLKVIFILEKVSRHYTKLVRIFYCTNIPKFLLDLGLSTTAVGLVMIDGD